MIRTELNMTFLLLLFAMFVAGCQDTDEVLQEMPQTETKYAQIAFNVTVPLSGLPSSRSISNDGAINSYVVWVFNEDKFVEAVQEGATYPVDGTSYPKISYNKQSGGKMYLMLSEEYTSVQLMMIANIGVNAPTVGTSMAKAKAALGTFTNDESLSYMPMCGENNKTFAVTHGADGGTITLVRAMAKVKVIAKDAEDHFTLQKMYVYRVNSTGTIALQSTITNNTSMAERIEGIVDENNSASVYIPEIADVNNEDGKTFVILEGLYNNTETKFYRLDFIKRTQTTDDGVTYSELENIERNHCYIFEIDYLTNTAGHGTLNEALNAEADNKKIAGIKTMVIDDVDVMDITTDNYIYLGVTAGNLTATKRSDESSYYTTRIRVVTNNSEGWTIEALPENVQVTMSSWTPESEDVETVQSVWVYIDGSVGTGVSRTLYIYSGNIRKKIVITTA